MDITSLYAAKLTTPERAVAAIPSGSRLSMGMYAAEPPALLKALADRAAAGAVDDLRVYYYETAKIAGDTILRYELNDRIHPYSMFVTAVERALIKRGMEEYSRTPDGALYTYDWVLPEKLAHVAGGSTTFKCPMHEEPLRLIPPEWREKALVELGVNAPGKPHVHIEGDLDPACRLIFRELMAEHRHPIPCKLIEECLDRSERRHLNVFEGLFRHLRFRRLAVYGRGTEQAGHYQS